MKIIKKIEKGLSMDSFNDSLKNLPCYGISVQGKYNAVGEFTINEMDGADFASEIIPSTLALNINICNALKIEDYEVVSSMFAKLEKVPLIILSSSQLTRNDLNVFREFMVKNEGVLLPKILVASSEDMLCSQRNGDMIYSNNSSANDAYEFDRLVNYVDANVPVLLDWQNNSNGCISRMIERTNGSDNLIVLSKKPKTTRRIINKTLV